MEKKYFIAAILAGLMASTPLIAAQKEPASGSIIGHVSVTGAGTLDQAEQILNAKAKSMGGSAVRITGVGGKNKLFATAEILK